jgi:hypothetical protein
MQGNLEHDQHIRQLDQEAKLGINTLREMKKVRQEEDQGKWDLEKQRKEVEWAQQQKQLEIEMQRERMKMELELNRLDRFKDMSEEQILAIAARESPEVARAIAEGKSGKRETELYERMLIEKDAQQRASLEALEKASLRNKETAEHALDKMAEVAQPFARGQNNSPFVVTPSGTFGAAPANTGIIGNTKLCNKCGKFVSIESRHCEHCGNKFEGMI